jgi:hypothetical protein
MTKSYKCRYGYCPTCTLEGCGCDCHQEDAEHAPTD